MTERALRSFVIGVVLGGLVPTAAAEACLCMPPGPPQAELAGSHAVFVGVVVHQDGPYMVPSGHDSFTESNRWFRLRVVAAWKGIQEQREVIVRTGSGGGDCGYDFTVGEAYIVYAHEHRDTLGTSICSRTAPLSSAQVDLAELGTPAVDLRKDRTSWSGYSAPTTCPVHDWVALRKELMTLVFRMPERAQHEYAHAAKEQFPYAAAFFVPARDEHRPFSQQALLCGWCREAALEWCYANGAVCPDEIFGVHDPPEPARPQAKRKVSDADYRKRHPLGNFAFLFNDGRLWSYDSIEGRLTLRRKTARDTTTQVQIAGPAMRELYERMIANRVFDLPAPNPGPHGGTPQAYAGACDRASLYVRSDTLVRMYSWRLRSSPAFPARAGHDEWRRLDDSLRAVLGALAATPEARGMLAVPIR